MERTTVYSDDVATLKDLIGKYCILVRGICEELNGKEYDSEVPKHYFMFLERFIFGWRDINSIMLIERDKFNALFSVPILVRAIINDCIMVQYLDSKMIFSDSGEIVDDSEFLKVCKDLDGAFINAVFEMAAIGGMTAPEYKANIKSEFSEYFEDGSDKVQYGKLTTKDAYTKVIGNAQIDDHSKARMVDSFYLFKFYSQYEHCSPLTKHQFYKDDRINFHQFLMAFAITVSCGHLIMGRLKYQGEKKDEFRQLNFAIMQFYNKYNDEQIQTILR